MKNCVSNSFRETALAVSRPFFQMYFILYIVYKMYRVLNNRAEPAFSIAFPA